MTKALFLPADEIKVGDVLPDKSRLAVTSVVVFPNDTVRIVHGEIVDGYCTVCVVAR